MSPKGSRSRRSPIRSCNAAPISATRNSRASACATRRNPLTSATRRSRWADPPWPNCRTGRRRSISRARWTLAGKHGRCARRSVSMSATASRQFARRIAAPRLSELTMIWNGSHFGRSCSIVGRHGRHAPRSLYRDSSDRLGRPAVKRGRRPCDRADRTEEKSRPTTARGHSFDPRIRTAVGQAAHASSRRRCRHRAGNESRDPMGIASQLYPHIQRGPQSRADH